MLFGKEKLPGIFHDWDSLYLNKVSYSAEYYGREFFTILFYCLKLVYYAKSPYNFGKFFKYSINTYGN